MSARGRRAKRNGSGRDDAPEHARLSEGATAGADAGAPVTPPRPPKRPPPTGVGPRGAEPTTRGAAVSAVIHGGFIGLAIFGTQIFGEERPPAMVFENVQLIDAAQFAPPAPSAPEFSTTAAASMASPMAPADARPNSTSAETLVDQTEEYVYGDVADTEQFPDLTAVLTPLQRAKVRPPKVAELTPANPGVGTSGPGLAPMGLGGSSPGLRAPGSPGGASPGAMRMGRSLSIDTSADDSPPPPAPDREAPEARPETDAVARAEEAQDAAAEDGTRTAEVQEEAQREEAPEAAADRTLTEADETDENADPEQEIAGLPEAPETARVPLGRPTDLGTETVEDDPAGEETPEQDVAAAEQAAQEQAEREQAAQEQAERERAEQEQAEREQAEAEAEAEAAAKAEAEAERVAAAKAAEEEAARKAAAAKRAEEEAARQAAAASQGDAPAGPPLSSGVKNGLRGNISKNWNTSMLERMPDYRSLVVTMRITLDRAGKIVGKPELISPSSASGPIKFAAQQAERALLKAQPYDLPPESYGRWKVIEVTFNPGSGVSM